MYLLKIYLNKIVVRVEKLTIENIKKKFPGIFQINFLEMIKNVIKKFIPRLMYIIDHIVNLYNIAFIFFGVYILNMVYLIVECFVEDFNSIIVFLYSLVILLPIIIIIEIIVFSTMYSNMIEQERIERRERRTHELHIMRLQLLKDLAELRRKGGAVHPDDYYINSVDDFYHE